MGSAVCEGLDRKQTGARLQGETVVQLERELSEYLAHLGPPDSQGALLRVPFLGGFRSIEWGRCPKWKEACV